MTVPDLLADALARTDLSEDAMRKLRNVEAVLAGDPEAHLLSLFVLDGEPYASVAFGDPDTADLLAIVLHGIDTDLEQFPAWADTTRRLCADVIRASTLRGSSASVATVAWFCYDSGTHVTALATSHATIGAARLAVDLDRFAAREPAAEIALIAYSYSSTLLGELVLLGGAEHVSEAFSIASAGMTRMAASAVEDRIADGSLVVHATEASTDGVAHLGRIGQHTVDPRDLDGAIVYSADGGPVEGLDGVKGKATEGHASQTQRDEEGIVRRGYFDEQGQAYLYLVAQLARMAAEAR